MTDHTAVSPPGSHVTVRLTDEGDARTLARLAALDSAEMPAPPTLLAEVDGHAVAALPVLGGSAVADPFRRTAGAVAMLELRAVQLRGEAGLSAPTHPRARRLRELLRAPRSLQLR